MPGNANALPERHDIKSSLGSEMPSSSHVQTLPAEPQPPEDSTVASAAHPPTPRRKSSIRFSEDTKTASRSPMSRSARNSSDENTPIRTANSDNRAYDTANTDGSTPTGESNDQEDRAPWYKRIAEKYGSVSLENKGSVARDHLALERTFLAWLRTSLAFASIGIAITQLFRLNSSIKQSKRSLVPLSPLLAGSVPVEMLPILQQLVQSDDSTAPYTLGPTLLDQLLLLPAPDGNTGSTSASMLDSDNSNTAGHLRHVGKPLGATFLGISIIILFIGFHRYFESQHWIIRGKFPASRGSVFIVAFLAFALIVASLIVVLVIAPTAVEN